MSFFHYTCGDTQRAVPLSSRQVNGEGRQADSRIVMILLQLRRNFQEKTGEGKGARKSQLITEVVDSSNPQLFSTAGVNDSIISDRFVCMLLAHLRDEICIGEKLYADEVDQTKNYRVTLIPSKDERFQFGPHDCLVVLVEDETRGYSCLRGRRGL